MNKHLARAPPTPNQQGNMEMRDELLSRVSAQDMNSSGYRKCGLEDNEYFWQYPDLNIDAVFRQSKDTHSSTSTFKNFHVGLMSENPILIDEEQDNENFPSPATTAFSWRPTHLLSR